jgi:uncharacterized protein
MKVVIDTNIFWVSISRSSPTHWIFKALLDSKFTLCVTNEILNEYEEIVEQKMGTEIATAIMEMLDNLPNVEFITRYYRWNLITIDPDDNPFVDCAVAVSADALITQDKHFNILKTIPFPVVNLMNYDEFKVYNDNLSST